VKEHFNNATNTKEGTDGQKLKKIKTDYDMGQAYTTLSRLLFACNKAIGLDNYIHRSNFFANITFHT